MVDIANGSSGHQIVGGVLGQVGVGYPVDVDQILLSGRGLGPPSGTEPDHDGDGSENPDDSDDDEEFYKTLSGNLKRVE